MDVVFDDLEGAERELLDAAGLLTSIGGKELFPLDFLAWAAANRSLGLIVAFKQLVETRNYLTAASLVRLQLDTALRFMAAWRVDKPHDFAISVLAGERIDRLLDRNGKQLRDAYLVELAVGESPWVKSVYKATSGFIHLSDKHIFGSFADHIDGDEFTIKISATDPAIVSDELRQEAVDGFAASVRLVTKYLVGWAVTKQRGAQPSSDA